MTAVPCVANAELRDRIEVFSEQLRLHAHLIGDHGLTEDEFYNSGLFRGAIERIRGQYSASMAEKREFVRTVLNYLQDSGSIRSWESSGGQNRHDYAVFLVSGRVAVLELKGCLDGNNTTIFERPPHANEFILWSICTNPGADPRHNVWSGIHTRLSAEIIQRQQQVDGLVVWDMVCGTIGRPCPKVAIDSTRVTSVGPYKLPPPCLYLFPNTIPAPRNNPDPTPHSLDRVEFLAVLADTFRAAENEIHFVKMQARFRGVDLERRTEIYRAGTLQRESTWTPIRRA